jgi:hypothetical protein
MRCAHCLEQFHDNKTVTYLKEDPDGQWGVEIYQCANPECNKLNLYLLNSRFGINDRTGEWQEMPTISGIDQSKLRILIRPKSINRTPVPSVVPDSIKNDYLEASLVLTDSPKASAALSRRCLQNLLKLSAGVKKKDLADQIQEVLDSNVLPSHIAEDIDAVRNIGNFAVHPNKSTVTGEILDVEPGEAEWNLNVLEDLFDFYYVRPAIAKKKRDALNAKITDSGKPPMK